MALEERVLCLTLSGTFLGLLACSTEPLPTVTGLRIVEGSGGTLSAAAGDAVKLKVVEVLSDGTTAEIPVDAKVAWSTPPTVMATAPTGTVPTGALPDVAVWIENPNRMDRGDDTSGVLFTVAVPDTGSVDVTATVSGAPHAGVVTATLTVTAPTQGNAARGATLYGPDGANCAACHGATGHGTPVNADGKSYTMRGVTYPYAAPGLNAEPDNLANDPAWSAPLFATAARADIDNHGVSLRVPMPDWLVTPIAMTNQPLATQDFADIFAFLRTQTK